MNEELKIDNFAYVKHMANPGDCVAVMAALKKFWQATERKVVFCQMLNAPAAYYQGAVHPTKDEDGTNVTFNEKMFAMMKPLIESQPYIERMEEYTGQNITIDFDVIRGKTFVNMPNMAIQSWIFYAYPDLAYNLSNPWIEIEGEAPKSIVEQVSGKIILNFTERYRNNVTDYFFLKKYMPDLIFAGTEREHFVFCNRWQLNIPHLEINDFLEYAHALKKARFILGNQSLGWNLSESMKTPRILELCQFAPNCHGFIGENSYAFYHQAACEYYFRLLYSITN